MFLNTAIDQRLAAFEAEHGRPPNDDEAAEIRAWVLANVRGTVQADILKEDQGQNTCIFSTEFALRMMADIQEWFVEHECATSTRCRSPATTSPKRARTPSASSPSRWPTASPTSRPTWPGAWTSTTSPQPLVLLLQRHGPRVHGARPGGPAHLGRRHARPLRRRRAVPEAEVPRADVGPVAARPGDGVQRHPHHAAGAHRDLRQRQQPAHQRLRRGGHHPDRPSRCGGRWPSS